MRNQRRFFDENPWCAVCGKPVEEFTEEWCGDYDPHRFRLTAECHGEIDEMIVTEKFLEAYRRSLRAGVAFSGKPALPDGQKALSVSKRSE